MQKSEYWDKELPGIKLENASTVGELIEKYLIEYGGNTMDKNTPQEIYDSFLKHSTERKLDEGEALQEADVLSWNMYIAENNDPDYGYKEADEALQHDKQFLLENLEGGYITHASERLEYLHLPDYYIKEKASLFKEKIKEAFLYNIENFHSNFLKIKRGFEKYIPFNEIEGLEDKVTNFIIQYAGNKYAIGMQEYEDGIKELGDLVDLKQIFEDNEEEIKEILSKTAESSISGSGGDDSGDKAIQIWRSYQDKYIFGEYIDFSKEIEKALIGKAQYDAEKEKKIRERYPELFMSQEQIENFIQQINKARSELEIDMDTTDPEDLLSVVLRQGVEDIEEKTYPRNYVKKYRGRAEISINGRKYEAVGHKSSRIGELGTFGYSVINGFVEYTPLEIPQSVDENELTTEQKKLYKMSYEGLDDLSKRIVLSKKALTQDFDQFTTTELSRLAILHGIEDRSYPVAYGTVSSYEGEVEISIKGKRYKVIGHHPSDSKIEWQPL